MFGFSGKRIVVKTQYPSDERILTILVLSIGAIAG